MRASSPAGASSPSASPWKARSSTGPRITMSNIASSVRSSAAPRAIRRCRPPSMASTRAALSRTSATTISRRPATRRGARVLCDLGTFVYMTLPNDHTFGVSPTNPDAGDLLRRQRRGHRHDDRRRDALSPLWASSLIVITEDDPSQGGRARRQPSHAGHVHLAVGQARVRVAHAHRHGLAPQALRPHPGQAVPERDGGQCPLPFDLFPSTRDYTPFTYTPRAWPLACGTGASKRERELTESWKFDDPDEQPGLGSPGHALDARRAALEPAS